MKNSQTFERGFGPLVIIVVIAVIALVGAGGYVALKDSSDTNVEVNGEMATATSSENVEGQIDSENQISLNSLLSSGRSVACTFFKTDASGDTSGTVYISGGQMRGDFVTKLKTGAQTDAHMIQKGNKSYMWSSAQGDQGIVMTSQESQAQNTPSGQADMGVDMDEALDYKCADWSGDASKFTLPSTVTFTDISTMMKMPI